MANRALDQIVNLSLKPIVARLAERARESVIETFCRERCGHVPEGNFCREALVVYNAVLSVLLKEERQLN